jgi:hypothetical protein
MAKASNTTMKVFFPRDNSAIQVKNPKGKEMGGSTTNLAHSLSGTSANMRHGSSGK